MTGNPADFWTDETSVLFTSYWGWSPETWGTVGWTGDRGLTRRNNLLKELTDPFITVCYVTSNKTHTDPALKGKIAGVYLVSHETGDRDQFTDPIHHESNPTKWRHSVRALRAFSYLPEYRLSVDDFDPTIRKKALSVASMGTIITNPTLINRLRNTPFVEVDVYKGAENSSMIESAGGALGMVRPGPASSEGYVVANGSQFTARELYVLRLDGNIDAYLGRPAKGRLIVKIGLAASPDLRRQMFQKAMPRGAFNWSIERTTTGKGMSLYSSHAVAVKGENAMKVYLAKHADWLGGEFYLASPGVIEKAWRLGCAAAKKK